MFDFLAGSGRRVSVFAMPFFGSSSFAWVVLARRLAAFPVGRLKARDLEASDVSAVVSTVSLRRARPAAVSTAASFLPSHQPFDLGMRSARCQ